MASSRSNVHRPTATPTAPVAKPTVRTRGRNKTSLTSEQDRYNLAHNSVFNNQDNDPNIESYSVQENSEPYEQYTIRHQLIGTFLEKGIGPVRSENLSKMIMNNIRYGVEYPDGSKDMIGIATSDR